MQSVHLRLSRDAERPLRQHIDELVTRSTALLFILSVATVFWWWQIDPLLESWLSSLPSVAAEGSVTIYDPHGWMSTRWSMIALLALITTLPFASFQILSFAEEGLLPSERKWLRIVTLGGVGIGLFSAFYWWFWGYPLAISSAGSIGGVNGINPNYDAVLIFEVGIGISWWIFLATLSFIGLTLANLLSLMENEPFDIFRVRIHFTLLFFWWLVHPSALEGVWLPLSILLVILPEISLRWAPSGSFSSITRPPKPVFDSEGELHRRMFAMCHCEGACPSVPSSTVPNSMGWLEAEALCLDPDARDMLLDAVIRNNVGDLIISGCNGTPLPVEYRQSLSEVNCRISGLEWLDHKTDIKDREASILAISNQYMD